MPGVARGHGTLKAARPEAWQWGGHMEGRVGRAEGLAKEVGARKPALGSQDPTGCTEQCKALTFHPPRVLPSQPPLQAAWSPLCWVGSWAPGLPASFKAGPLLLPGVQER